MMLAGGKGRAEAGLGRGHDAAAKPTRRLGLARPRLGHRFALCRVASRPSSRPRSYGHTGYTGTAIWIDPATRTFLIVLTNRLHPDGKGNNLQMLRRISDRRRRGARGEQPAR